MKVTPLEIPDVILFEPKVFGDDRGFFFESFNQRVFEEATGLSPSFVQDNHSKSTKGVLRGLHYQLPPMAQGKLVRVVQGEVYDVAVDIRKSSSTFGKWVGEVISEQNKRQLWIPEGFAHGYITLSDTTNLLYKTTNYYAPEFERGIRWDDPDIGIDWANNKKAILSVKDEQAPGLSEQDVFN